MLSLRSILSRQSHSFVREGMLRRLSMTGFLWLVCLLVRAQSHTPQVYTYVEQMPQLPGGGGTAAIAAEVQKRVHFSAIDTSKEVRYSGIKYTFVVDSTGVVRHAAMVVSSDNLAVDNAILEAVRSLPRFHPGSQAGRPVSVRFTMRIGCILVQ